MEWQCFWYELQYLCLHGSSSSKPKSKIRDVEKADDFAQVEEEAKGFVTEAIDCAQKREDA